MKNNMVYGVFGVGVNKGNYNASFDKTPKSDNNGIMYATPQCFQFAVKHQAQLEGHKVLYKKIEGGKNGVMDLKEAFTHHTGLKAEDKKAKTSDIKRVLLTQFKDIGWFGCTFATANIGIMGAIQIGFATNRYDDTDIIIDKIISPFASSEEKSQTSLGDQYIVDEAHYTHSFTVNPFEYKKYIAELGNDYKGFTEEDYDLFKKTSLVAVSNYNSKAKAGCQNEFALFVETKDEVLNTINLNGLDQYISVYKDGDKVVYDLSDLAEVLNSFEDEIKSIEIYYNNFRMNLVGDIKNAKVMNIFTKREV